MTPVTSPNFLKSQPDTKAARRSTNVSKSTIHPWNHTLAVIYDKERFNLFKSRLPYLSHDGGQHHPFKVSFSFGEKKVNTVGKEEKCGIWMNELVLVLYTSSKNIESCRRHMYSQPV